jgi:hypothetical protein
VQVERYKANAFVITHNLVIDQRDDIIVEHHLLAVRQILESTE